MLYTKVRDKKKGAISCPNPYTYYLLCNENDAKVRILNQIANKTQRKTCYITLFKNWFSLLFIC